MADDDKITFLDLACLLKIQQDTTLERFGSTINASVFDAANITGSLKQKGLIDFTAYYPGPNSIVLTDAGKKLQEESEAKSSATSDDLDDEILRQLSGGKRHPLELQNTLNIRPKDLALRIYKLFKQNLLGYELRNGTVELMLTEQGFLKAKTQTAVQPQAAGTEPVMQSPAPGTVEQQAKGNQPQQSTEQVLEQIRAARKGGRRKIAVAAIAAIIIIAVAVVYLYYPQYI